MKSFDRLLQKWRIVQARPFIPPGARVLDIGCRDGALFRQLDGVIAEGMGIDPELMIRTQINGKQFIAGFFPRDMPDVEPFDAIVMLAVLEHFPEPVYAHLGRDCARFLKPGGALIITVPSPKVDYILKTLKFFRLMDADAFEQHHGYEVAQTTTVFPEDSFLLKRHSRFQLGLNNLFVFERCAITANSSVANKQIEDSLMEPVV